MVNYKDLGLVNTREMFAKAIKGGYAIPAFNYVTSIKVIIAKGGWLSYNENLLIVILSAAQSMSQTS